MGTSTFYEVICEESEAIPLSTDHVNVEKAKFACTPRCHVRGKEALVFSILKNKFVYKITLATLVIWRNCFSLQALEWY
jgi:hypothetical protein